MLINAEKLFLQSEIFMNEAYAEAEIALFNGDVPVGAVVVKDGKIIGRGHNTRETDGKIIGHAEISAISEAEERLHDWRLDDCNIYVTMEPCPMCMGAIIQSRIGKVFFGCGDPVMGDTQRYANKVEIYDSVCEEKCRRQINLFFDNLRKK